jgi:hypothetical protein
VNAKVCSLVLHRRHIEVNRMPYPSTAEVLSCLNDAAAFSLPPERR